DADFSALRRTLQDSVAARDADALEETRTQYAAFLQHLHAAHGALDATEASALESGFEDYYSSAREVSRRMIAGETGEGLVSAMRLMQAKQTQAAQLLQKAVAFDRGELVLAFSGAARAEETAGKLRLYVSLACLLFVMGLSWWLSRGVLRALAELSAGFERVGRADFDRPIVVHGSDELSELAVRANQMAENLRRLHEERERADWLRAGRVGLAEELRGELSLDELGARAVRFLARYLEASLGALYYLDGDRILRLAGTYGLGGADGQHAAPPSFRLGEGLLGQACLTAELTVLHDPPSDFLRARSALGEGAPSVLAFLPLSHAGSVTGALELGMFGAWSERFGELLGSVAETLAIAIEVARGRAAMNELLAETQRQAERLTAQEEELQASNEMLHSQQEELRQTNEELTQQASALEAQQLVLQGKNSALDQASRHLRQKAEELTRISTYKSQFLANMSHELRTPLNSMLLLSSLLADNQDGNLSGKQVEYCRTIHSSGKDLLGLINQVLDLAKVEAGKQELRLETLALARLVDHAERVFRPLAADKHLEFRVSLDPSLPESIVTDQQRIQQIVNNLLANAIKFTLDGSVSFEIRRVAPGTSFRRPDLQLEQALALSVTDTGVGIAPEHQERIFAPFEQVEAASDRRFGGTGLGLTIAREMAQLLGGELSLTSEAGKGSTFVCHLPFQA
ncbi:MAG TPA: ATP-binding protein, partial [Polyangiaceae bacterium]|nr:ATP-binding protein [Polyangiaceae bacterium]